MKNFKKRKKDLQDKLESITTKVTDTVFDIQSKNGRIVSIDTTPRDDSPFSPGEFANYEKRLALIVGFGQCSCINGSICEEAKKAPMMFVLFEDISGICSVLKEDWPDFKKM